MENLEQQGEKECGQSRTSRDELTPKLPHPRIMPFLRAPSGVVKIPQLIQCNTLGQKGNKCLSANYV